MKSIEDIVDIYTTRRDRDVAAREKMRRIRDLYNGDVIVPLPEIDQLDEPAVANLALIGIDGMAQRTASVMPAADFPELGDAEDSRKLARRRRDLVTEWWSYSDLDLRRYQLARWFYSYARIFIEVRPDIAYGGPCFKLRDPLSGYLAEGLEVERTDAVFIETRPRAWVRKKYPGVPLPERDASPADLFDVLEYHDENEHTVLIGMDAGGYADRVTDSYSADGTDWRVARRWPNFTGLCTVVAGYRMGLSRPIGQFDSMTGMYQTQAMLQALDLIAVKRSVFPDQWIVGRGTEMPVIVREADGIRGVTGVAQNGDFRSVNENPGYQAMPAIANLERNQRIVSRVPAEFGGEAASNVRTGRRGDSIMAQVVDFPVMEAHNVIAGVLREANRAAIAIDREWWGGKTKTVWIGNRRRRRRDSYDPKTLWTDDSHNVSYASPGSDANGLVIAGGQRVGMGTMSKRSFMEMDPMVEDVEQEMDQVTAEALEQALLSGLQQQAATGEIPAVDLARIIQLVEENDVDLARAIQQAQQEAQARQAAQQPSPEEMQPGLAQPGMGVEPAIAAPPQALTNATALLGRLRLGQMQGEAEREGALT